MMFFDSLSQTFPVCQSLQRRYFRSQYFVDLIFAAALGYLRHIVVKAYDNGSQTAGSIVFDIFAVL